MKVCSKCKIEKHFEDFYKDKSTKDGFRYSCKSCDKQHYENNKEYRKKYREKNKEHRKEYSKQYYKNNKEELKDKSKQWIENNKEYRKEYNKEYQKQRKQTDSIFKFRHNIRCLIIGAFKRGNNQFRKDARTEQILGCTIEEFMVYIQSKFKQGMSFENYGEWHLDHIIPLASANTEEEIIRLNHYTNFQPLWSYENLSKGCKIDNVQLKLI